MSTVQSVHRAFLVLQKLSGGEMGVTELADASALPKSTVARLLKTLEAEGAVEHAPESGAYRIGSGLVALAGSGAGTPDLISRVRPQLVLLSNETDEDAGLSVPDGYRVHYVAQAHSDNPIQLRDWTGDLVPMHVVASGLVMLAHWPDEPLERYLRRPLQVFTDRTVTDPEKIRARLAEIRRDGHAWVFEEYVEGINAVAAVIRDARGRPQGAVHVHGPSYRFPPPGDEHDIAELVMEKARLVSEQLEARQPG
jgi:DNA-binding IclR family transcriptional regulator